MILVSFHMPFICYLSSRVFIYHFISPARLGSGSARDHIYSILHSYMYSYIFIKRLYVFTFLPPPVSLGSEAPTPREEQACLIYIHILLRLCSLSFTSSSARPPRVPAAKPLHPSLVFMLNSKICRDLPPSSLAS